MGLEGFVLLRLGGDQGAEAAQARGDALLCGWFGNAEDNRAQDLRRGEDIRRDDFIQQPGELGIREADAVQGLEFLAEVGFEGGAVVDVPEVFVFELLERTDKAVFDVVLADHAAPGLGGVCITWLGWSHRIWRNGKALLLPSRG